MELRRLQPDEGRTLRAFRLRALCDAPSAFARTAEEEEAEPLDSWEHAARRRATSTTEATFVAIEDGQWTAFVGAFVREDDPSTVELVSMWTAPEFRGRGAGRRLVDLVLDWAAGVEAVAVGLWVTRGNDAAVRLYERAGFEVTGDYQPLPSDPCKEEIRMRRAVSTLSARALLT